MSGAFRENCFKLLCTKKQLYDEYRNAYPIRLTRILTAQPELLPPPSKKRLTDLDKDMHAASAPLVS